MRIRSPRDAELAALREIERAAGEIFRTVGMPEIADDEPPSLSTLRQSLDAGRAWVAVVDDVPAAYLVADMVDGCLHVEQVTVHPRWARRGIGRQLLDHAASYARSVGAPALTLTTFTDVPWNAPYYARCGFVALADEDLTPGLRAVRAREAALGLDRWPRVCMRLPL